jgi:predicted HD superfamily hydrolase involved in NAD metabolism
LRLDERTIEAIRAWVKQRVGKDRFSHILGVENAAVDLGRRYQLNVLHLRVAALFHDSAKEMSRSEMRSLFRRGPFLLDPEEMKLPALWHPHAGANLAYHHWGCRNREILDAVRCHTLGRPGMGKLAQAVFVADYIEKGRRFPGLSEARKAARTSLAEGVKTKASQTLAFLLATQRKIHPRLVETWNDFAGMN